MFNSCYLVKRSLGGITLFSRPTQNKYIEILLFSVLFFLIFLTLTLYAFSSIFTIWFWLFGFVYCEHPCIFSVTFMSVMLCYVLLYCVLYFFLSLFQLWVAEYSFDYSINFELHSHLIIAGP